MYTKLIETLRCMGITYSRLARMIEMPTSTMYYKIHGLTSFTLEEAVKIRETLELEMTVEELFEREEKSNDN